MNSFLFGNRTETFARRTYFGAFLHKRLLYRVFLSVVERSVHLAACSSLLVIVPPRHELIHKSITSLNNLRNFFDLSLLDFFIEMFFVFCVFKSNQFLIWSCNVEFFCRGALN